jgi:2-haloalkanoic acid dehalogenase type II
MPRFARDKLLRDMPPKYSVITFDCYGTLIDWESGIRQAFRDAARADAFALDDAAIIPVYAEAEAEVEREAYRPYREVLAESARRAASKLGWKPRRPFLAESLASWRPFPDTNAALERLAASGHRLGILSNVDDDLLAETRRHFTVPFALVVTAQQVRSYKPGRAHFDAARRLIGDASWLHAAASNYHDIAPTNALGIENAWVNRTRATGERPTYEFRDLGELAETIV